MNSSAGADAIVLSHVVQQHPSAIGKTLNDVSICVPNHRVTLLLGENGSGKSTLLNCVIGVTPFESGTITVSVSGKPPFTLRGGVPARIPSDSRKSMGVIFQQKALWPHYTVLDNLRHPLQAVHTTLPTVEVRARVEKYAGRLNLSNELLAKYPLQLSGGQQRKAAIARTLAIEPELLIIDELEANLDQPSLELVLNVLEDEFVSKGKTVLMISHRPDLIERFVPYVIVLPRPDTGKAPVSARNVDALIRQGVGSDDLCQYVCGITDPPKQWFFARECLAAAKDISSLTLGETNEGRLLSRVGSRIAELISRLDPNASHLLLIATQSKSEYRIRSAEVISQFPLDGDDAHKLADICDAVAHSPTDGRPAAFALKRNHRELMELNEGIPIGSGRTARNGLIDWMFEQGPDVWEYRETAYSETIPGAFWMGIPIPKELIMERQSYNEFSKETKHVYLIAIQIGGKVKGVISIDTTAKRKWSNFIMEQFVVIANMAAIAMKQLESGEVTT